MPFTGKREDATTNLNGVTATGAGSWVGCGEARDVVGVVQAAGVTTGATLQLQGNTKRDGTGITYTIATVSVSATGNSVATVDSKDVPAAIRWNVSARTDGTYTATIARRT